MRLFSPSFAAIVATSLALSLPGTGFAQPAPGPDAADRDTARKLLDDGDGAFEKKDYQAALKAYSAAHAIMGVPSTGVAVAKAQAAMGLLLEARDMALEVTRMPQSVKEPAAFAEARKEAFDLAAQLDPRIPSIEVKPSGLAPNVVFEVSIDGTPIPAAAALLPRRVNPGAHHIVVKAPGYADGSADVTALEGAKLEAPIELKSGGPPLAPKTDATKDDDSKKDDGAHTGMSVLLPIGIATTGAGLAVGIGTGIAALNNHNCRLHHGCALGWAADAGFVVAIGGAAMTTAGVVITLTRPKTDPKHTELRLQPLVGPAFLGIRAEY